MPEKLRDWHALFGLDNPTKLSLRISDSRWRLCAGGRFRWRSGRRRGWDAECGMGRWRRE